MGKPPINPQFHGLHTVIYQAPDLNKAKEWYSTIFEIQPYFDQRFHVGFNVSRYELGLDPDASRTHGGKSGSVTSGALDK